MKRVRVHGRGKRVFAPKDFLDLGSRAAVDQVLSRLRHAGVLRRVSRGLYDWPRHSPVLDAPAPVDSREAVAAISRRVGPMARDSLAAANAMGLTTAVPTRLAFVAARKAADVTIDGRRIKITAAPAAVRRWLGSPAAPIIQALVWARDTRVSLDVAAATIARHVSADAVRVLAHKLNRLPGWATGPAQSIIASHADKAA